MRGVLKNLRNARYIRHHLKGKEVFVVEQAGPELAEQVRKLQAKVYLHHGNINSLQINEQGVLDFKTDPYFSHSAYFAAKRKDKLLAGARLILPVQGYSSLQISKEIPPDQLSVELKQAAKTGKCCEMSGLVKDKGAPSVLPLLLIRDMYKYASKNGFEYILMSVSDSPYQRFKMVFGDVLHSLGEPYKIPHGNNLVHPCYLQLDGLIHRLNNSGGKDSYSKRLVKRLMSQ